MVRAEPGPQRKEPAPHGVDSAATPSVELVQSVPTDVYRVPSRRSSPAAIAVVLVPEIRAASFTRAAAELSVALCASVCVVGLAGHREAPLAGLAATARFTLPEQVAHVSAFLGAESEARLRGPSTQRELVVVGHSIGAYIGHQACTTAKLATGTKLSFCGLNPYLENNATPENRLRVRGATSWWAPLLTWVLALFAGLLEAVGLKRLLLRNDLAKMEDHCAKVALGLPAFSTLLNILYLFRSEAAEPARRLTTRASRRSRARRADVHDGRLLGARRRAEGRRRRMEPGDRRASCCTRGPRAGVARPGGGGGEGAGGGGVAG